MWCFLEGRVPPRPFGAEFGKGPGREGNEEEAARPAVEPYPESMEGRSGAGIRGRAPWKGAWKGADFRLAREGGKG